MLGALSLSLLESRERLHKVFIVRRKNAAISLRISLYLESRIINNKYISYGQDSTHSIRKLRIHLNFVLSCQLSLNLTGACIVLRIAL